MAFNTRVEIAPTEHGEPKEDDSSLRGYNFELGSNGSIIDFLKKILNNETWLLKSMRLAWEDEKKEIEEVLGCKSDNWGFLNDVSIGYKTLKENSVCLKNHKVSYGDITFKRIKNNINVPFSGVLDGIPYYATMVLNLKNLYIDHLIIVEDKNMDIFYDKCQKMSINSDINLPYDKIVLSDEVKEKFIKSTFGFLEDEELRKKFKKHYMRFKRCLLLSGPPGNGKTALLTWLRSQAEIKKWRIFTWDNLGSDSFLNRDKMDKTLFLLEDIDGILSKRDGTIYDSKGIGFSRILNLLDGADKMDNYVVVMTTNYPDLLDEAVLRDGRTDEHIIINYPDRELKLKYINSMIKPIMGDKFDINKFEIFLKDDTISFATLDNLRKKIFIYGTFEKALETFKKEIKEDKKVGFCKK